MSAGTPWWASLLLRLHPSEFRSRYGEAVREMVAARARDVAGAGMVARVRIAVRESLGLLASAGREWLRVSRRSRSSEGWGRTLRLAARRLGRAPGFSVAAIGMLALGVGSTMAVYTLLHRVVLRPLPYEAADRLVWLDHVAPGMGIDRGIGATSWLYAHYLDASRLLDDIALAQASALTLIAESGPAERLSSAITTASAARVFGVSPLIGRWFEGDEDAGAVVLSEGLWRGRFGGEDVLGRTLRLGDASYEVIGVMPDRFAFPGEGVQLWTTREFPITHPDRGFNYEAVGRMAPGATVDALRSELQSLVASAPDAPGAPSGVGGMVEEGGVRAEPVSLQDRVVGPLRETLWLLLGAVAVLLVTAWANVANLFLVRAESRQREVAVRRALGAGGAAIARFFVAEGLAIGAAAGAAGLFLAWMMVRFVAGLATLDLPRSSEIAMDGHVVGVGLGVALASGIALTLLPLVRGSGGSTATVLREGGRSATSGRARLRIRAALMAGQVALAMTLLAGAGLLLRSWSNVRDMGPGFAADDVLFVELALSRGAYSTREAQGALFEDIADRIGELPGVAAVGLATCVPLDGYCWGESVTREGVTPPGVEGSPTMSMRRVSPGYFDALELPVLAGRAFTAEDRATRADVVVLSAEAARRLFPDRDPIGTRVAPGSGGEGAQWFTVVGVAADAATSSVLEPARDAVFYLPLRDTRDNPGTVSIDRVTLLVRGGANAAALVPAVRGIVQEADATLAPSRIRTLDQVLSQDRATLSFTTLLLVIAGAMGLLLSALGVYAVFAWVIGRRTAEFGLRLALGARAGDISRIVLRQAGSILGVGVGLGLVAALLSTRLLESFLFGVDPLDPVIFAVATLVLICVALLAAAIPTRRAWRLRPVEALRAE